MRREYIGENLLIGQYLETLQRPDGLMNLEYRQLRRKSKLFFVRDRYLYMRGRRRGARLRRVVGLLDRRMEIVRERHDEIGHRGK
jgi:hypothetical protein